jgi:hypothetical protein
MKKYCKYCDIELELCKAYEPYWEDHMICPICHGTYDIFELNKCDCKYAHHNERCKWPTLKGRLNQPQTNEKEALLQLQTTIPLSKDGEKQLKKLMGKEK